MKNLNDLETVGLLTNQFKLNAPTFNLNNIENSDILNVIIKLGNISYLN